jgi:hypothetical protein
MLSVIYAVTYIECHIKALNAEFRYAQCRYVKSHCAECLGSFKSSFKKNRSSFKIKVNFISIKVLLKKMQKYIL